MRLKCGNSHIKQPELLSPDAFSELEVCQNALAAGGSALDPTGLVNFNRGLGLTATRQQLTKYLSIRLTIWLSVCNGPLVISRSNSVDQILIGRKYRLSFAVD